MARLFPKMRNYLTAGWNLPMHMNWSWNQTPPHVLEEKAMNIIETHQTNTTLTNPVPQINLLLPSPNRGMFIGSEKG